MWLFFPNDLILNKKTKDNKYFTILSFNINKLVIIISSLFLYSRNI